MKRVRIVILSLIALAIVTYVLGTISWEDRIFKNIAFFYLGNKFQKEISADSVKIAFLKKIEITNLEISGKKGFTISAGKVKFDYNLLKLLSGGLVATCEARDVKILRKNFILLKPLFELLLPSHPLGNLSFQNLHTDIYLENNTFIPKNLEAVGRSVKVYGNGSVNSDEIVDYKLKFLIASKKLGETLNFFDILKGLTTVGGGKSGWVSLTLEIKGKKNELSVFFGKD